MQIRHMSHKLIRMRIPNKARFTDTWIDEVQVQNIRNSISPHDAQASV